MKANIYILFVVSTLFAFSLQMESQSEFDMESFKTFLEENKNVTTADLLKANPLPTYYSERDKTTDLNSVCRFDSIDKAYQLTAYEKELLSKNHFMVSERFSTRSWAYSFINVYSRDLPLFISSDFVLHTLHRSYDDILLHLEKNMLEPNLHELLQAMYDNFGELYDKYNGVTGLENSLNDVDLYISVALSLAKADTYLPQKSEREMYDLVMEEIQNEQLSFINLFTVDRERKLDFSQFKPRGHYTKKFYTEGEPSTLENYFRAMMWLGRIDFLMTAPPKNPWESDWTTEELQRMQISALLLNEVLNNCGKRDLLELHEKIIGYLVGPDDNLNPDELNTLATETLNSPKDVLDENIYTTFTEKLNSSDDYGQKIMSNFFYVDPKTSDPGKLPISFKLLGQKFLLDSYVTSEVVYDRITWEEKKIHRGLPDPLDVMAALGNEDAMHLMKDEMEKYKYAYKLESLKKLIGYYDDDFWDQSLYNVWLSAIRSLNPTTETEDLPYFMRTTAWRHEKLNTQLTSWAELRHDNILYGKQSYTGGTGCSYPYTYIEPYPELYKKIGSFSKKAETFFNEILGDDNTVSIFYKKYGAIIEQFAEISEKEIQGASLSDSEIKLLKTMINEFMSSGPSITGWYTDLFFNEGLSDNLVVADIHTQPTDEFGNIVGYVYHVGSGMVDMGVFLAPNPTNKSELIAFAGPVSSFRYEITKNFYRFTDEEWSEKFWGFENLPLRPDWVNMYMANRNGEAYPEGPELPGIPYVTTETKTISSRNLDYALAFPNPDKNEIHIRFILTKECNLKADLFDIQGRMIQSLNQINYKPGEYNRIMKTTNLKSGIYMVRITAGNEILTKKIVL